MKKLLLSSVLMFGIVCFASAQKAPQKAAVQTKTAHKKFVHKRATRTEQIAAKKASKNQTPVVSDKIQRAN